MADEEVLCPWSGHVIGMHSRWKFCDYTTPVLTKVCECKKTPSDIARAYAEEEKRTRVEVNYALAKKVDAIRLIVHPINYNWEGYDASKVALAIEILAILDGEK